VRRTRFVPQVSEYDDDIYACSDPTPVKSNPFSIHEQEEQSEADSSSLSATKQVLRMASLTRSLHGGTMGTATRWWTRDHSTTPL
jgi:hypothetical protein